MNHTAAFHCAKCPRNNNPEIGPSCPAWWETVHNNIHTGHTKVWKSCAWEQLPTYLIEVIKASNRPAAAVESTRNEISKGFQSLAEILHVKASNLIPDTKPYIVLNGGSSGDAERPTEDATADRRGGEQPG